MTLAKSLVIDAAERELISLASPEHELDAAVLDEPGGFIWWYVDHIDQDGNGFVCIWSFGLPFLPGALSEAHAGATPRGRPSVNLAIYKDGNPQFYLLQEYPAEAAHWNNNEWTIGASTFKNVRRDGRYELQVRLNLPIAGSHEHMTGQFSLRGALLRGAKGRPNPHHQWSPACGPAHVDAQFETPGAQHTFSGPAYHDRNSGCVPMDQLGIHHWTWGRVVTKDSTRIYYCLWPEDDASPTVIGLDLLADGQFDGPFPLGVRLGKDQLGLYGFKSSGHLEFTRAGMPWLEVTARHRVDDGPFYVRETGEFRVPGESPRLGMIEWVEPQRIDRDWQRPFVRMRVHRVGQKNSAWLPLFSGTRHGRLQRLLRRP